MDGVLADLSAAYRQAEERRFGPAVPLADAEIAADEARVAAGHAIPESGLAVAAPANSPRRRSPPGRRDKVWRDIQTTPNFWMRLAPLEQDGVARIHRLMLRYRWEVFFITQRPRTAGDTVQRQTQRWLVEQGFDLPTVLVISGSRGAAAQALRLDYHLDDSPQNCLDVLGESGAKTILVVPGDDQRSAATARTLGIATVRTLTAGLDILERVTQGRGRPEILAGIAAQIGWRA